MVLGDEWEEREPVSKHNQARMHAYGIRAHMFPSTHACMLRPVVEAAVKARGWVWPSVTGPPCTYCYLPSHRPAAAYLPPPHTAPLPFQVRRMLLREIRILRSLPHHPCVVTLLDAFRSQGSGRPYLVFEHMERSLHKVGPQVASSSGTAQTRAVLWLAWSLAIPCVPSSAARQSVACACERAS